MVGPASKTPLKGLAKRLVIDGLLEESIVQHAIQKATASKTPFVIYLVQNKIIHPTLLATTQAQGFGLPLFDLSAYDTDVFPNGLVNEQLIRHHHMLPLYKRENRLYLAISDPTNQSALDEIKFHTGLNVQSILVEEDKLSGLIEQILAAQETAALGELGDTNLDTLEISVTDEAEPTGRDIESANDAPIVRFVNKILLDAIHKGASDIHFEPYEKYYRIRFRQDGILYDVANPPVTLGNRLASRLKIMSQLDISERRVPLDGRFKMILSRKREIDFRVSTCPTIHGEKIVMRILDPGAASMGVDSLGMDANERELFVKTINKPQGMILVTGPTGNGKTMTLYTALNLLNTVEVNISTVEDPVEIHLPGVNQVNINTKTGLTFATALRAFLRQDPDIIMVGEMRDLETAEIGIKAAQTGHLVLSTLHTNSAPETLTRLLNMGVVSYNIATSVSLIIAQRLARRLCEFCKRAVEIPEEALIEEGFNEADVKEGFTIFGPVGCDKCRHGYKGRSGLFEILSMNDTLGQTIMTGGSAIDINRQAREEGMNTLYEAGLKKVKQGITSLEEVHSVTKDE